MIMIKRVEPIAPPLQKNKMDIPVRPRQIRRGEPGAFDSILAEETVRRTIRGMTEREKEWALDELMKTKKEA